MSFCLLYAMSSMHACLYVNKSLNKKNTNKNLEYNLISVTNVFHKNIIPLKHNTNMNHSDRVLTQILISDHF